MRPPDKEYGKNEVGVCWGGGEVGSEAAFVSESYVNSSLGLRLHLKWIRLF